MNNDNGRLISFSNIRDGINKYFSTKGLAKGLTTGWFNMNDYFMLKKGMLHVITGIPSSGKALHVETQIPTPFGFTTMGDIQAGDRVFDENGKRCNVTAVTSFMYDRPCYELTFNDGTKIISDEQHEWFTEDFKARCTFNNKRAKDRIIRRFKERGSDQSWKMTFPSIKTTKDISLTLKVEHGKRFNHAIKKCAPVEYNKKDLKLHPYLLGVWLGDGRQDNSSITVGPDSIQILDVIKSLGYEVHKVSGSYAYYIQGIAECLRHYNLIKNKHIPLNYLQSDEIDRRWLLKGLMDTDGYISKNGNCNFYNTNKTIIDGTCELLGSLGIIYSVSSKIGKIKNKSYKRCYNISFTPVSPAFMLDRKLSRQKNVCVKSNKRFIVSCVKVDSVPVKCIQVDSPSHLYLCTKSFIPTHNSELLDQIVLHTIALHEWHWTIFSPENWPLPHHFQKLAEKWIGKPMFDWAGTASMTQEDVDIAIEELSPAINFIQPPKDNLTIKPILELVKHSKEEYDTDAFLLDPWNELEHHRPMNQSETEYIGEALTSLRNFGRLNDVGMFIVAHPTKLAKDSDGNYPVPTPYDITGSANWRNKADVCITVWRDYQLDDGVVDVHIQKVRNKNLGRLGQVKLFWHKPTGLFVDNLEELSNVRGIRKRII